MTVEFNFNTLHNLLQDQHKLVEWLQDVGLLARKYICPTCGKNMKLRCNSMKTVNSDLWQWRCKKNGDHDRKRSIRKGTWIESSNLNLYEILMVTYMWCLNVPPAAIISDLKMSSSTVAEWSSHCRDVCTEAMARSNQVLGGPGTIVEIEECSFVKQSRNRGRKVEKRWVFRALEHDNGKCFMVVVPNTSKDVLLDIIRKRIRPGTTILSECWKAYDCLEDEGYKQLSVVQGITFGHCKPDASNEGTWAAAKQTLQKYSSSKDFHTYLFEYMWRREHENSKSLIMDFLESVATIYPPASSD